MKEKPKKFKAHKNQNHKNEKNMVFGFYIYNK